VLSAGCASGEEPYSIAMTLRSLPGDAARGTTIRAVDVNPAMLAIARRGRYRAWSLRETPPAMRARWFRAEGDLLALDDAIRAAVAFEERNLGADDPALWTPGAYDVVFCRNVMMYFTPQGARALVERIASALAPGGLLFLGHAETLRGLSQAFSLQHTHGCFHYRLEDPADRPPEPAAGEGRREDWFQAIGRAALRVRALATPAADPEPEADPGAPARPAAREAWDLAPALELLGQERFDDALALVHSLPAAAARDPDVLLLDAALLVHGGDFARAERACRRLLALDASNAGAYHVLALCCEGRGDLAQAAACDQRAVELDPAFAMPHMHLGLLARRGGDRAAARRALGQALALLPRESAMRLKLFAGGFGRDALLALCRAELRACEETA